MTYQDQLTTKEWSRRRHLILERDGYKCQKCQASRPPLIGLVKGFGVNSHSQILEKGFEIFFKESPKHESLTYKSTYISNGKQMIIGGPVIYVGDGERLCDIDSLMFAWQKKERYFKPFGGNVISSYLICFYSDLLLPKNCIDHNVHHKYYKLGSKAWEYEDDALITVCVDCHKAVHSTEEIFVYSQIGDKLYKTDVCDRCEGSGYLPEFDYNQGGICFKCHGEGVMNLDQLL